MRADLPIAYRGYVIYNRKGSFHIVSGHELISLVPTLEKAKEVIDDWMDAK